MFKCTKVFVLTLLSTFLSQGVLFSQNFDFQGDLLPQQEGTETPIWTQDQAIRVNGGYTLEGGGLGEIREQASPQYRVSTPPHVEQAYQQEQQRQANERLQRQYQERARQAQAQRTQRQYEQNPGLFPSEAERSRAHNIEDATGNPFKTFFPPPN